VKRLLQQLALVAAVLPVPPAAATDLAEARVRGTLRALVSADESPEAYSFKADGPPGFDRELLEGFARLHGLRLEAVPVKRFADMIPRLKAGDGDVIAGIIDTEARRREIAFTAEVLPARLVAVCREPRPAPSSVAALAEETVGVIPGNAWAKAVAEAGVPPARTVSFADVPALLKGLREGGITATVMSVVDFTMAKKRDPALRAGTLVGSRGSGAWGLRSSDTELKRALDDYLTAARRSGSWSQLVIRYYGQDALDVLGRDR
jgi:ABC-type amino acid transport substrate-binding protein